MLLWRRRLASNWSISPVPLSFAPSCIPVFLTLILFALLPRTLYSALSGSQALSRKRKSCSMFTSLLSPLIYFFSPVRLPSAPSSPWKCLSKSSPWKCFSLFGPISLQLLSPILFDLNVLHVILIPIASSLHCYLALIFLVLAWLALSFSLFLSLILLSLVCSSFSSSSLNVLRVSAPLPLFSLQFVLSPFIALIIT